MDLIQFDRLACDLGGAVSRRGTLAVILVGALAPLLSAGAKGRPGKRLGTRRDHGGGQDQSTAAKLQGE